MLQRACHSDNVQSAIVCKSKHCNKCLMPKVCTFISELVALQVVAWYDNEWGYSQRVVDLAEITAKNWE